MGVKQGSILGALPGMRMLSTTWDVMSSLRREERMSLAGLFNLDIIWVQSSVLGE